MNSWHAKAQGAGEGSHLALVAPCRVMARPLSGLRLQLFSIGLTKILRTDSFDTGVFVLKRSSGIPYLLSLQLRGSSIATRTTQGGSHGDL